MKMTFIPIIIGALNTGTKGLIKGLGDLEKDEWRPSKLQPYWDRPECCGESCRLEETCCHVDSSERPLANADM